MWSKSALLSLYFLSYHSMSLKTTNIIYRVSTLILAFFILLGLFFMNSEMAKQGMDHVGLTNAVWLQHLVGFWAPLAILLIIIPWVWSRLKERAYVGLGSIYLGAFYAHFYLGDPIWSTLMPLVTFTLLLISYLMWHRVLKTKGERVS